LGERDHRNGEGKTQPIKKLKGVTSECGREGKKKKGRRSYIKREESIMQVTTTEVPKNPLQSSLDELLLKLAGIEWCPSRLKGRRR